MARPSWILTATAPGTVEVAVDYGLRPRVGE